MAIPDHVKRQALDAVSHKETTAQIRLYRHNDAPAQTFTSSAPEQSAAATQNATPRSPIPDDVKKQAMDAIANKETMAMIRLVKDTGSPYPMATPSKETSRAAEKVAQMHQSGQAVDSVHRHMTKDNFEVSHG
jgi:hypothetical protein